MIVLNPSASWNWCSDKRTVVIDDCLYAGTVSSNGDLEITIFSFKDQVSQILTLEKGWEKDDHCNPSLLTYEKDLYCFYTYHSKRGLYFRKLDTKTLVFSERKSVCNTSRTTYSHSFIYENKILVFWRGENWKIWFSFAQISNLEDWSKPNQLFNSYSVDGKVRPYTKLDLKNETLYFSCNENHPRDFNNSVYSHSLRVDTLFDPNFQTLNLTDFKLVHKGENSWIWSVDSDYTGYYKFRGDFHIACLNEYEVLNTGSFVYGNLEEPHYSAGLHLDAVTDRLIISDYKFLYVYSCSERELIQKLNIEKAIRPFVVKNHILFLQGDYDTYESFNTKLCLATIN